MHHAVTRRTLIQGTALAAVGAASMAGVVRADEVVPPFESTVPWDAEYDVIVAGYGAAGAFAAISAAECGTKVLLMEKAIKPLAGGNSRYGQNFNCPTDREPVIQYFKNLRGAFTEVQSDEVIEFLIDGFMTFEDWLLDHGYPAEQIQYATRPEYPELYPDAEFTGFRKITLRPDSRYNAQDVNAALECLRAIVEEMRDSIDVWYDAPAEHLVQDPTTRIVHGVTTTHDGAPYAVRAKNGVVLATGGFENNLEMIQNFTGYEKLVAKGCWCNTGDAIVMAQEVGAKLWHMTNCAAPDANVVNPYHGLCYGWTCACGDKVPPNAWYGTMGMHSSIIVGPDGTRFMNEACNETRNHRHGQVNYHGAWMHQPWPGHAWQITDEASVLAGAKPYTCWSDGWAEELDLGIAVKADTLEELGMLIGVDGTALEATVARYNAMCEQGFDEDYNRQVECLFPFVGEGPWYAVELVAGVTNTDGGAMRNIRCEVLNPSEEPIPHLYSAGTNGSFWVGCYNGGGNMGENYVTGVEAGKNAAEPKDDVTQESCLVAEPVNFADTYERTVFDCAEGQYVGRYAGMNGELAVRVTFDGSRIVNVEVLEHNETPQVGTRAVEQLPAIIVEHDSTAVDTIAGATRTSAAIIIAVESCMREAGVEIKTSEQETATLQ